MTRKTCSPPEMKIKRWVKTDFKITLKNEESKNAKYYRFAKVIRIYYKVVVGHDVVEFGARPLERFVHYVQLEKNRFCKNF